VKTFKIVSLNIVEQEDIKEAHIPLYDGLIINQEEDNNRWIIESFIHQKHKDTFKALKDKENLVIEVKITKESNDPATFSTKIISINDIDDKMNVIFVGKIIDERKNKLEKKLANLIEKGHEGEDLLQEFKDLL